MRHITFFPKIIGFVAASLLCTLPAMSQDQTESIDSKKEQKGSKSEGKLKDYDEIVIKRKNSDGKDTKVVLEIKGDQVLVDGKPIDEFSDDEVSVRVRSANRYEFRGPGKSLYRNPKGWVRTTDGAYLGVFTEGSTGGAKIVNVSDESPAAKAGLKKDDVITRINDKDVFDHEQLTDIIRKMKPEEKITVAYKRKGKEHKINLTLGKRPDGGLSYGPDAPMPPIPPMAFDFDGGAFKFDDKAFDLSPNTFIFRGGKPRLGIKAQDTEDSKGVKVVDVDEGSPAEKAGVKEDDIITSFDGKTVNSVEELAKASREAGDKSSMSIQLNRDGKSQTVEVKIPKKLRTAEL